MSMSTNACAVCGKSFKRLQSHLAQNLACKSFYMSRVNAASATVAPTIPNDSIANTTNASQGGNRSTFPNSRTSLRGSGASVRGEAGDPLHHVNDLNAVDDDNFVMFEDNDDGDAGNQDAFKKLKKRTRKVLILEEKVLIELLDLLRKLHCPLKAFTVILKWAAKSNASGHVFREGFQPTREKVIAKLYERYNMNGLIPKEKKLYLPYTQRIVSMVFFDAREVFASLLSCPTLNQDTNYFFDEAKDPFVAPQASSDVGDIHTGRCYRKTYDALIKDPGVDMLLPCVMAMDKTHIDMAGRLQMEPITVSHGLLNHITRRLPSAMRILGYINHSTPANLPSDAEIDPKFNAPADLPKDVHRVNNPIRCPDENVSWATLLLNETHMQIQFILEESGFLQLQKYGFRWNLQYNGTMHPVVFHPYVPFIIGDTEGHDRLCGHYTARFSQIKQLCRIWILIRNQSDGTRDGGVPLVKLFALHTTCFRAIFDVGKKEPRLGVPDQRLRYENHVTDWIDIVTALLVWHQWMKQPSIPKKMVKRSHVAVQWLMRVVAEVAPRPGAMGNNTIKTHLVLHLCEDILDHGVPENVNSSYAESAHIPLAKVTSRNTQKRAVSFTKQAAHRYVENLVVSLASADMDTDKKAMPATEQVNPLHYLLTARVADTSTFHGRLVMNFQRAAGLTRLPVTTWRQPTFQPE
ncbi:hypothetical protein MHU86_23514 [Fragilaria crotonensis]|nr:hypothetical protein MHU86_23514 [Fragilaria crotonensis]